MKEIAALFLDHHTAPGLCAAAQSTAAMLLGLLAAMLCRRNAAAREAFLRLAMVCAVLGPLVSFSLWLFDVTPIAPSAVVFDIQAPGRKPLPSPRGPTLDSPPATPTESIDSPDDSSIAVFENHQNDRSQPAVMENGVARALSLGIAIWLAGVLFGVVGAARSWWKLRRVIGRGTPLEIEEVQVAMQAVIRRIGSQFRLARIPSVLQSPDVSSPLVAGIFRPVILLPSHLCGQLGPDKLRAILIHELAHVLRKDHLAVLLEGVFAVVCWPHPLAHLLRRQLALAREEVCDNYVLQWVDGLAYSETLLWLARRCGGRLVIARGIGLFGSAWKLEHRIAGLLDERRNTMIRANWVSKGVFVGLSLAVVLSLGAPRLVAQRAEKETRPGATPNLAPPDAAEPPAPSEPPVADVNGAAITKGELTDFLLEKHGRTAVENLIHRKVIEQACRKHGVSVSDAEVEAEIKRTAKKFGLTVEQWRKMLLKEREMGMEQYRRDIVWPALALRRLTDGNDESEYFNTLKARAIVETPARPTPAKAVSAQRARARRIAVIDIAKVFRASSEFTRRRDALKRELERSQRLVREQRDDIAALDRAIKSITDNEDAKSQLQALISKKRSEMELAVRRTREEMLSREAAAYHDAYRAIHQTIREYAEEHNIDMVVRSPGQLPKKPVDVSAASGGIESSGEAKFDAKDRKAVLQQLNQHIIYVREGENGRLDITEAIIKRLEVKPVRRR